MRFCLIVAGVILSMAALAGADVELPEDYAASTIAVGMVDGRDVVATPDGRLFIALGGGDIRVLKNDALLPNPMITIPVDTRAQEGLHSLALDENFEQNGYLYAVFTPAGVDVNRLSRFTVTGDTASLGSQQVIYDLPEMDGANSHYGAAVIDNGDGTLLLTIGDHETEPNGQDRSTKEGSVLRINKNGTIPNDNPYVGNADRDDAIFAYGFRNPWQIARSTTGLIAVSDVGASNWEELNLISEGGNYGWAAAEGNGGVGQDPLFTYPHFGQVGGAQFEGCAITGSTFYEPDVVQLPSRFVGQLFVGDLCSGWITAVDPDNGDVEPFATGFDSLADMVTNPDNGALYVLDRKLADGRSGISKIEFVGDDVTLRVTSQPTSQRLAIGQDASFFVAAIGQGDLNYQWQRNGVNIPGATSPLLEIDSVDAGDNGDQFRARITDDLGTVQSSIAEIIVTNNNAPEPAISAPTVGSRYRGGQSIVISGSATDVEDGNLGDATLTWEVRLNHDAHDHGFTGEITGDDQITIQIPRTGETSSNVWYTVYLRATDSDGATTTITRRIDPRLVDISLRTSPAGGLINLDGPPQATPLTVEGVQGVERTIRASVTQDLGGVPHGFVAWSDNGDIEHTIVSPNSDRTYTAEYAPLPFGQGGAAACQVVSIGDSNVTTFSGNLGSSVNLRRSGRWIQTVTGFDVYVDGDNPSPGATYEIRVRGANGTTTIPCTVQEWPPDGPPDPPGGGDVTCVGETNGNSVTFTFTGTNNVSSNLRADGSWVANVRDLSTYTHSPAEDNYVLRTKEDGVTTNTPCTVDDGPPDPPGGGPSCVGTTNGNSVTFTFTGTDGSSNLRSDDGWVAGVRNLTTYTHSPAETGYILRTKEDGVTTNTSCTVN